MKTSSLIYLFLFVFTISTYADVIPNPIQVKGIVPNKPVNIQMVSEKVTVDMYKDSSIVVCVFNMRNLGKAQNLEIGFPVMNFYLWTFEMDKYLLDNASKNNIDVTEDGKKIDQINMYVPAKLRTILKSNSGDGYSLLDNYTNQNRPWYLWKDYFNKNESRQIVVKYILPNGANKLCSFFNYLLSTGAGWKGNIEDAQVIVNLKNVPTDQLIEVVPKNYEKIGNTLSWDFKNLKPTVNNDVLIKYEVVKGSYQAALKKIPKILYFVNNKPATAEEIDKIKADVITIRSIKQVPDKNEIEISEYTNDYSLEKFKSKVRSVSPSAWGSLANENTKTIANDYIFIIDEKEIPKKDLFKKLTEIDSAKTLTIDIKRIFGRKKKILLTTK